MYNLIRTIRTMKTPRIGVITTIGIVAALTMLLAACPDDTSSGGGGGGSSFILKSPANLAAEIGDKQVVLTWDAVPGATEYRVYRGPNTDFRILLRISEDTKITGLTYTDTGLTNGTTYRYTVRTVNGDNVSADNNEILVVPGALGQPANFSVALGDTQAVLSWDAVDNAAEYRIYRADTAMGDLVRIASAVAITDTTYVDTGLANGTAYRYTVRAANAAGESTNSTEQSATPAAATAAPGIPADLSAISGNTQVTLSWDPVDDAAEYLVYRADTSSATLTPIAETTTITAPTYTDTGLTNFTTYRYTVRAKNSMGESTDSDEITATPDDHSNTRAGATPIPLGPGIIANLHSTGDTDYFSVEIPAASTINPVEIIATTTGTTDTVGRILNSRGGRIASDGGDETDQNFRAAATVMASGTYYIEVKGQNSATGNYFLTVSASVRPAVSDDHGNTARTATPATFGVPTPGTVEDLADRDYFAFEITTASDATPVTIGVITTGGTDTWGFLLDSSGDAIGSDNNTGIESGNLNFRIISTVTESGFYYAYVRGRPENRDGALGDYGIVAVLTPTPSNLVAVLEDTEVTLSWDAVADAEEYRIYRDGTRIAQDTTITDLTYTDTGLANGTAYRYVVRAVHPAATGVNTAEVVGEGGNGAAATVTTAAPVPGNLTAPQATPR